jgi:hypothetical protein
MDILSNGADDPHLYIAEYLIGFRDFEKDNVLNQIMMLEQLKRLKKCSRVLKRCYVTESV